MRRVVVIGGGITGLAAAHRLGELAASREMPLQVTLLEQGARAGGPLHTIRRDGFVMETGADSILTEKPWAVELAKRLGLERELVAPRNEFRTTLVVRDGRLAEVPEGFSLLAPARLAPILKTPIFTPLGKLRIMLEPLIPRRRGGGDESLASFVTRRLGREVLDRVAQPLAGGIYTSDASRLSIAATIPRFVEMERRYGSLYLGLRAAERMRAGQSAGTSGARWSMFVSFRNGLSTLVDALAGRLADSIRFGAKAEAFEHESGKWRVKLAGEAPLDADAIVCAAPAYAAARLIGPIAPKLAGMLATINYASAATVNLTYRANDFPSAPRSVGFVAPIAEQRKIIAGSFSSLKFDGRAPAGTILARVFLGGVLQSGMMAQSDDDLVASARDEFRALLGVTAAPGMALVQRWPDAMAQYEVGHLDRIAQIESAAAEIENFAIAGAAFRGVGIPDCVHGGEQAAEKVFERLAGAR
ncbi:MAG TPA: protoporphyrinogen oxidase [Candidatus Binataceae bacterium]|nr:protoporphyrinogen oxidase [Candidatus Binataceae bacterium]